MIEKINPYKSIWINPKQTFERLADNARPQPLFGIPVVMLGVVIGLDSISAYKELFEESEIVTSLITALIFGILFSFLIVGFLMPLIIRLFGRIWKGRATLTQLTNVCSFSFIPFTLILIYQIGFLATHSDPSIEKIHGGITYILWLWSFSLLIIGVSKVQGFSYGFALLNILLSNLPIILIRLFLKL